MPVKVGQSDKLPEKICVLQTWTILSILQYFYSCWKTAALLGGKDEFTCRTRRKGNFFTKKLRQKVYLEEAARENSEASADISDNKSKGLQDKQENEVDSRDSEKKDNSDIMKLLGNHTFVHIFIKVHLNYLFLSR